MSAKLSNQVRFSENNFNKSFDNLNKHEIISNKNQTRHTKIFDYIQEIERNNQKSSGSMFFKSGWYLDRTIINSLCLNVYTSRLNNSKTTVSFPWSLKIWYLNSKYFLTFTIRNDQEAEYLNFLCDINKHFDESMNNWEHSLKLKDFMRLFYVLEDNGGKSIYDTNEVFSVTTHEVIGLYTIMNGNDNQKSIQVYQRFKEFAVDYKHGHLLHFRENMDFYVKPINPSAMGFDLNYYDYFKY